MKGADIVTAWVKADGSIAFQVSVLQPCKYAHPSQIESVK